MILTETTLGPTNVQTLSNTVFGSVVVLLEAHTVLGNAGTVVLVLSGPIQPCILPISHVGEQSFQPFLFDDTNRLIKCRLLKDGESVTIKCRK